MTYKLDIVKHRNKYFIVTIAIVLVSVLSLLVQGLNLGVDFKSGTRIDITIAPNVSLEKSRTVLEDLGYQKPNIRVGGPQKEILIFRTDKVLSPDEVKKIRDNFSKAFNKNVSVQEQKVDPIIGLETARNAMIAVLIAAVCIIIYVSLRFEYRFAVAAVLSLLYDALFIIGMFSLFRIEVDLVFVAAVLTIVGYSINDTIVIFDRIRENMDLHKPKTWDELAEVVNTSINQTLVRSINTVLTVVFAAFALWLLGGESISNFSLALLFGLISGAYSSIFVASPIWIVWKWHSLQKQKQKRLATE
ncbi:protein translocase subunit SecF [Thermoactinomyces daqus]|uniref:protein translocase subunit SecF n=1 Tax=Thermoactinomyces TaxID=2023 RepID=UPI000AA8E3E7|nr:protein translocase subunit SecF [Thermoactinomyces daqus]